MMANNTETFNFGENNIKFGFNVLGTKMAMSVDKAGNRMFGTKYESIVDNYAVFGQFFKYSIS